MSYEIALYPRTPGQDWAEVVAADELDGPEVDQAALDRGVATFRRIEAQLREHLTEPVEVWVAEETDGDVFGELTGTESGLQVELYDRSASVSFPVRSRADRALFLDQVRRAVRIVATETGYEAYDPQVGRSFDGLIEEEGLDPDELRYAAPSSAPTVTAGESGPGGAADGGAGAGAPAGLAGAGAAAGVPGAPGQPNPLDRMDPKMLNRRAWLYIILGGFLATFGFMRFGQGLTNWFTWLIFGFGAFNLLAGFMIRGLARQAALRAEQNQNPGSPPH